MVNRLLISKILGKWGITADFAENGIKAIEKIESSLSYDVVLMDVFMPEMSGIEATQILRARTEPYFQNLNIIALTASTGNNRHIELYEAGMNDYITKPFNPQELYEKLSKLQK